MEQNPQQRVEKWLQYVVHCYDYAASDEYKNKHHSIVTSLQPGISLPVALILVGFGWGRWGSGGEGVSLLGGRRRGKQTQHGSYHRGGSRSRGSCCRSTSIVVSWAKAVEADTSLVHGGHNMLLAFAFGCLVIQGKLLSCHYPNIMPTCVSRVYCHAPLGDQLVLLRHTVVDKIACR